MATDISFGVLAGGMSRRMGINKSGLLYRGSTFLDTVLNAGRAFQERIVSLSESANSELESELNAAGILTVRDELSGTGPLEGIRQILTHTNKGACLITATDMPFLTEEFLMYLSNHYSGSGNLALTNNGYPEPLCSIYSRECLPVIEEMQRLDMRRPSQIFRQTPTAYIAFEDTGFPESVINNINSAEDYRKLFE